ncbi:hypothetical protein FRC11_003129, partial [Ceratobasidium sp. 423]
MTLLNSEPSLVEPPVAKGQSHAPERNLYDGDDSRSPTRSAGRSEGVEWGQELECGTLDGGLAGAPPQNGSALPVLITPEHS